MQQLDHRPESSNALASEAGPWQFSLAQMIGLTTGLALMLGAALSLFRQRSLVGVGVYEALTVVAVGIIIASALAQPWRAIIGAIGGSIAGIVLYALAVFLPPNHAGDTIVARMTSPTMLSYSIVYWIGLLCWVNGCAAIAIVEAISASLAKLGRTPQRRRTSHRRL